MIEPSSQTSVEEIDYPDSDGKPMADNTLQFRWIVTLEGGVDALFRDDPNVFVAGDLLWYPVQGNNRLCVAPDVLVAFGRPKGDRGSYRQWVEGGIAPQVVWEVLSPNNTPGEMNDKLAFYQQYGVEEYYQYDPDRGQLRGWQRQGNTLEEISPIEGWTSPRLGIRLEMEGGELVVYRPDGQRFLTFVQLTQQWEAAEHRVWEERQRALLERQQREAAQQQSEQERLQREAAQQQAAQERLQREAAQQQAEQERQQREAAQQRAEQLAAKLRALGIDPES
jgi:Uma2 family endonuclease